MPYNIYESKRPKHEPTDIYFYLTKNPVKCMMRADDLKLDNYPVRTEMTGKKQILILHVCSTDDIKSKEFLADKNLSQVCSMDEGESESFIVD